VAGILLLLLLFAPTAAAAPFTIAWAIPKRLRVKLYENRKAVSIGVGIVSALLALPGAMDWFRLTGEFENESTMRLRNIAIFASFVGLTSFAASYRVAKLAFFKSLAAITADPVLPMPFAESALARAELSPGAPMPRTTPDDEGTLTARRKGPALDRIVRVVRTVLGLIAIFLWFGHDLLGSIQDEVMIAVLSGIAVASVIRRARSTADARHARRAGAPRSMRDAAAQNGWSYCVPADARVVRLLGEPFIPLNEKEPPLYPYSLLGSIDGRVGWVVEQHTHLRTINPIGLAVDVSSAHAIGLWLPGVQLPLVEVNADELVRLVNAPVGTKLELESFNRSVLAWGSDPRTTTAILHPRMMQIILRGLPDGARLEFRGERVLMHRRGKAMPHTLPNDLTFLCTVAHALPTWLLREMSAAHVS
jgi:hypothetical protein